MTDAAKAFVRCLNSSGSRPIISAFYFQLSALSSVARSFLRKLKVEKLKAEIISESQLPTLSRNFPISVFSFQLFRFHHFRDPIARGLRMFETGLEKFLTRKMSGLEQCIESGAGQREILSSQLGKHIATPSHQFGERQRNRPHRRCVTADHRQLTTDYRLLLPAPYSLLPPWSLVSSPGSQVGPTPSPIPGHESVVRSQWSLPPRFQNFSFYQLRQFPDGIALSIDNIKHFDTGFHAGQQMHDGGAEVLEGNERFDILISTQ
jgi:hypothetical protein